MNAMNFISGEWPDCLHSQVFLGSVRSCPIWVSLMLGSMVATGSEPPPTPSNPGTNAVQHAGQDLPLGIELTASEPRGLMHQVWASGDFLYGRGYVTLPINFSLAQVPGLGGFGITPQVAQPPRITDYIGSSVSYGYNQEWYFDIAYRQGSSSGDADVPLGVDAAGGNFNVPSQFSISESWYQAFVRWVPPWQRNRRLQYYGRAGISYVTSDLTDRSSGAGAGLYYQKDETKDILGNLGLGLTYYLKDTGRLRMGLQLEAEGFYGSRQQRSLETLPAVQPFPFVTADIDNTVSGGFGRGTLHLEYRFGESRRLRAFMDTGGQVNYSVIKYPNLGSFDELLWGPFGKLGLSYRF